MPFNSELPIYLISMAGVPNYGDELIARRWLEFLAEYRPETEVWLDAREPGTAASLFKGIHPRLNITNTVFRANHEFFSGGGRTPADLVRQLGSPRYDLGLLQMREAGTLHLLGGGFINSTWPENQQIVEAMRATAEISGAQLFATGQGLMPRVEENFEGFTHVSVRDLPSAQALGITRGWDDAYLMSASSANSQEWNPETAELYICVQQDALAPGAYQQMIDFARAQIQHWGIERQRIRYVEAIPGDDYAGYDALRDLVAEDGFIPFSQFWRDGFSFSSQQVWLTSRFHHHLMGSLHGARGVVLGGNPGYYDIKHGSLLDSGSAWKLASAGSERLWDLGELTASQTFARQQMDKLEEAKKIYGVS